MSDSSRPRGLQPTRLLRPWDFPGKSTGVGCHCLLQCRKVKSESEVAQSCPTLRDPVDCSPPGSSVHGILQARVLEWVAVAFSYIFTSAALKPLLDRLACENTNPIPAVECQTLVGKKMTSDAVSNENTASELREILF